jgi:hypothetical protein
MPYRPAAEVCDGVGRDREWATAYPNGCRAPPRDQFDARPTGVEYVQSDWLVTKWIGVAAAPNGEVFEVSDQTGEYTARAAAKYGCEQATGRTCYAISVPMTRDVVAITCTRPGRSPMPLVGGSGQNAALDVALGKAVKAGVAPSRCTPVYEH